MALLDAEENGAGLRHRREDLRANTMAADDREFEGARGPILEPGGRFFAFHTGFSWADPQHWSAEVTKTAV